jgi:hypothetical protein
MRCSDWSEFFGQEKSNSNFPPFSSKFLILRKMAGKLNLNFDTESGWFYEDEILKLFLVSSMNINNFPQNSHERD